MRGYPRHAYGFPSGLSLSDGRELPGMLVGDAATCVGAVVIVHDFFGLTPTIRAAATELAALGFLTFAPDLYRGEIATSSEHARTLAQTRSWKHIAVELGVAVLALRQRLPHAKVAVLGFAMGGAAAIVAAAAIPNLAAVVTYYGIPQDVSVECAQVKIQGHFGTRDHKCTPERVRDLGNSLGGHHVDHEFHHYDAANGFANPAHPDHAGEHAQLAWSRSLTFLRGALT